MVELEKNQLQTSQYRDGEGRLFEYVHIHHPGSTGLAVHFSAFFGKWGNAKPYRDRFQGYFHRLKMLGLAPERDWLFLCDSYGAFDNGCYYTGQDGDLFVERAMEELIGDHIVDPAQTVMVGSSMGATAALKFGARFDVRGIVAIGPHIDLDTSARMQNRMAEVAWICPDGDPLNPANHPLTRQIRNELADRPTNRGLPRLFVQSCADDVGVHEEQVMPLLAEWQAKAGMADLDVRPVGGHTSDYATRGILLDAISAHLDDRPIDLDLYQNDPEFRGELTVPPLSAQLRRRASLLRKRLLRRR